MDEKPRRFEAQVLSHLDAAHNLARWLARPPRPAGRIAHLCGCHGVFRTHPAKYAGQAALAMC